MQIRSITYFLDPGRPFETERLAQAEAFVQAARPAFEAAGYPVQTARLATLPFPKLLPDLEAAALIDLAKELEYMAGQSGFQYISLGPALVNTPQSYQWIPEALAATENVFFSGSMTSGEASIDLNAVRACAEIIHRTAPITPNGFANLRFAALANVPPGSPFFPAAYHDRIEPRFSLATEAADLAVQAFRSAGSVFEAQENLIAALEKEAEKLKQVAQELEERYGLAFGGIDFSPAPFPEVDLSLGRALENLGVPAVGLHGSLAAAAILAEALDRARIPRAGFTGLMLPVLEDAVLARRAAEGTLNVKDMLLYSAVCGTGLDTVPLPGDTTPGQISAVLLDLAALSRRLDKPLTARLMPIPGKLAGDETGFEFAYFANSRVLDLEAETPGGLLAGPGQFSLFPRDKALKR